MIASYLAIGLFGILTFTYFYLRTVFNYWKNRNVTGPKPIPLFGNIIESALRRKHIGVVYQKIYNDYPNEKYVGFYRMTTPSLLIRDPEIIKQILIKDFDAFPDRGVEYSKEGLGDNLFHCDAVTWKALKSRLSPLFTSGKLRNIVIYLKTHSDKLLAHVESVCSHQQEVDMMQLFQKYTIASVMSCFFGIDVDTFSENTGLFEKIDRSMIVMPYVNELEFLFPGVIKKANLSLFNKIAIKYCYEIVEAVKHHRNNEPIISNNAMDILFALRQEETKSVKKQNKEKDVSIELNDHVIAGQVFIFFAAGYANNTNVLSYTMYHLARNPEIQDKLTAEIDEVLNQFDGKLTYESVNAMTYLEQVFSETLRMHTTANSLQRKAARNYTLPGTDLQIEKDMSIVISPMAIHYDPILYPNPTQFDPDRFLPEVAKSRHSCAYLPFGIGPRSCIASRFAKLQYKVCVVRFLSKYRVEPSGRTKDEYIFNPHRSLLGPTEGIHLNIVPRTL